MTRTALSRLVLVVLVIVAVFAACSGRPPIQPPPAELGVVAGRVLKGPVTGATVTVFRLDGTARGASVGTATTDAEGAFRIEVGTATGPFLVVATAGAFVDEATGVTVQLNSSELTALVPTFEVETKLEGLRLTPVSHLAAGLALYWTTAEGKTLAAADAEAWQHLNSHFGGLDWRSATPTDVTAATGATLDEPARQGLLLAALSMEARLMAETAGLTPGGRVNPLALTAALFDDLTADGFLDGVGHSGQLVLPSGGQVADAGPSATQLDGQTARTALAQAIAKFLASDRNVTKISLADAQQLITAIATNADSRLFRGSAAAADVAPPVVAWVTPATDNAGVHGMVTLEVRASDNVGLKTFVFTAPAALVGTVAVPTADGKTSTLSTTWDVSGLADGPVSLTVKAIDTSNNEASKTLTVVVSNHGPSLTITAPAEGAVVHGSVQLIASASAQSGTIAKLELRSPPPGVGADTLPAADSFFAAWDSTKVLEGPQTLTFHAEDSLGGITDQSVTVVVDNLPLGIVNASLWVGQPLAGAQVRLLAIDALTGAPATGLDAGPVLGEATVPTDADGGVSFPLSQENYAGPVQLEASGQALSVTDPSDGLTAIAVPGALKLTSYVANYRTGDVLQAHASLWTTLADAAAKAAVTGKADAGVAGLPAAMAVTDALMSGHISRPAAWSLRAVRPVPLTTGPQSLRDAVYAAMPDVALHQLARDLSAAGQLTPGGTVTAFSLTQQLAQDVGDGLFDGKAAGSQLSVAGTPTYALDANTTRFQLASALDAFIRGPANLTGLKRSDIQPAGVFDAITNDGPPANFLYPAGVAPVPFDAAPPTATFTLSFTNGPLTAVPPVGSSKLVGGALTITVDATDLSDMQSLGVTLGGAVLQLKPGNTPAHFSAVVDTTTLADGPASIVAHACDKLHNCGDTTSPVVIDNLAPVTTFAGPVAGSYNAAVAVDASATDAHGVATATVTSLAGFSDTNPAAERVQGTWTFPTAQPEGALAVTVHACDVAGNCGTQTSSAAIVDKTPPSVSLALSYLIGTGPGLQPVGATKALGGTMSQAADATDPAGLTSLVVTCAGATLVPAASGNTAAHVVSSLLTTALPDGQRVLSAHACDAAGNCGDTTAPFTIDNTAPSITVVAPAAAAYVSASFGLEATATDITGVASLVASAPAGLVDQDAAPARFFLPGASWTLSAADGPLAVAFAGCDLVGNCRTVAAPSTQVDTVPPALTLVQGPGPYTNGATATVKVSAVDTGAGVAAVYGRVQGGAQGPVLGTLSGGVWTISGLTLATEGAATITVWGVDSAVPANSGAASAALTINTLVDRTAPAPAIFSAKTFRDEDTLSVQLDGAGRPVVPVVYLQPTGIARTLAETSPAIVVKRASTRWNDSNNQPVLTYQVPLFAGTQSPIVSATWTTTAPACPTPAACTPQVLSGVLASVTPPTGTANNLYYELPLSLPVSGLWTITSTFTDAAGNVSTVDFHIDLALIGPPVVVVPDTAWETSNDPNGLQAQKLSASTYTQLYGCKPGWCTNPFAGNRPRLARFLVYNPATVPVSVAFSVSSSARTTTETWTDIVGDAYAPNPKVLFTADGFQFPTLGLWWANGATTWNSCLNQGFFAFPFPCSTSTTRIHYRGSATQYTCDAHVPNWGATSVAPPWASGSTTQFTTVNATVNSPVLPLYWTPAAAPGSGNEQIQASGVTMGVLSGAQVPPATAAAPGVTAIYLTVGTPLRSSTTNPPLDTSALPYLAADGSYRQNFADFWWPGQPGGPGSSYDNCDGVAVYRETAYYWYRKFTSASTFATATWNVYSAGLVVTDTGGLVAMSGLRAFNAAGVPTTLSRTVPH